MIISSQVFLKFKIVFYSRNFSYMVKMLAGLFAGLLACWLVGKLIMDIRFNKYIYILQLLTISMHIAITYGSGGNSVG